MCQMKNVYYILYQGASATAGETPANMRGFIDDVVKAHNAYRKKHGKVVHHDLILITL